MTAKIRSVTEAYIAALEDELRHAGVSSSPELKTARKEYDKVVELTADASEPEEGEYKIVYVLTAWSSHRRREGLGAESRPWYWASSRERCLEILRESTDFWMEDGTYSHAIVESFKEGSFLAESEEWFEVPYDREAKKYGEPVPCTTQSPGTCSWGLG